WRRGSCARRRAPIVPFPAPEVPASPNRTPRLPRTGSCSCELAPKLAEERLTLVAAQTAQAPALRDVKLLHQVPRANLPDAGQRLEHAHPLQLGEHSARFVAAVRLLEQFGKRQRTDLQLVFHFRP